VGVQFKRGICGCGRVSPVCDIRILSFGGGFTKASWQTNSGCNSKIRITLRIRVAMTRRASSRGLMSVYVLVVFGPWGTPDTAVFQDQEQVPGFPASALGIARQL
jgi:hypothetical protein